MVSIYKPFTKKNYPREKSLSKMVFAIIETLFRIRKNPVILEGNDLKIILIS